MKRNLWFVALSLVLAAAAQGSAPSPKAVEWFRDAKFGMFIHWGPYSLKGVEASWLLFRGAVPRDEYEALPRRFDPTKFDARAIAHLAKRAGMKYLVFTSKHHDGLRCSIPSSAITRSCTLGTAKTSAA